ncbi:MAG: hypothetical protein ABIQ29_03325 [Burkholderiaceae bacterium]
MKKLAWIGVGAFLLVTVAAAMLFAAYLVFALPQEIGKVTVNGEVLNLHGAHAGHWLLASLIILVALIVVMVVVPAVALLALIVPVTLAAFGLATGAAIVGLLLSPLILLGWWLYKRSRKPETIVQ